MQQIDQLSREEKIRLIKLRFKTRADLWLYMTERLGYLMQTLKNTTMSHLDDILYERKKVLHQKDVPAKKVPGWPELSVKQCYGMISQNCPEALDYLPTPSGKQQRLPEREFFWQVVYSLFPVQVEDYILLVEKQRRQQPNLQDRVSKISISDNWLNELLKYDFTSTKKGRGHASLLIDRKKRQPNPDQNQNNQNSQYLNNQQIQISPSTQILQPPAGVMDVKKWHDQLTPKQQAAYQRGLSGMSGNKSEADVMNHQSQLANQLKMSLNEFQECQQVNEFSQGA